MCLLPNACVVGFRQITPSFNIWYLRISLNRMNKSCIWRNTSAVMFVVLKPKNKAIRCYVYCFTSKEWRHPLVFVVFQPKNGVIRCLLFQEWSQNEAPFFTKDLIYKMCVSVVFMATDNGVHVTDVCMLFYCGQIYWWVPLAVPYVVGFI